MLKIRIKYIILAAVGILYLTTIALYSVLFFMGRHSASMVPVYRSNNKHNNWLISFASNGIYEANQNFLASKSVNKGFDFILNYSTKDIDQEYYNKHKEILSQKRGAGYWLWKPYLIKKTLKMMADGDMLFYIDVGNLFLTNTDFFIDKMSKNKSDILLFKSYGTNVDSIKRDAYEIMEVDEKYRNYLHIGATIIILRKSARSIEFINQWLKYCENPQLITDSSSIKKEYPDFVDSRHDQSILTLLYYKNPKGILLLDYHNPIICDKFFHHRRRFLTLAPLELSYYYNQWHNDLCHYDIQSNPYSH